MQETEWKRTDGGNPNPSYTAVGDHIATASPDPISKQNRKKQRGIYNKDTMSHRATSPACAREHPAILEGPLQPSVHPPLGSGPHSTLIMLGCSGSPGPESHSPPPSSTERNGRRPGHTTATLQKAPTPQPLQSSLLLCRTL